MGHCFLINAQYNIIETCKGNPMEQIVIQVEDKEKARLLCEILSALDFVNTINTDEQASKDLQTASSEQSEDFFSFAGLWADRNTTIHSIRQKAWPRRYS